MQLPEVKSTIVCKFVVESLSLPVFLSRFSQEALLAGDLPFFVQYRNKWMRTFFGPVGLPLIVQRSNTWMAPFFRAGRPIFLRTT